MFKHSCGTTRVVLIVLCMCAMMVIAGCRTMSRPPNDEALRNQALGRVTVSTPLFTPIRSDTASLLKLSSIYTEEQIKKELNQANTSLSQADIRQVAMALSVAFAGPSINQSANTNTLLGTDGSTTTSGESSSSTTRQTPGIPDTRDAPSANEDALKALVGLLTRSDSQYQLPPGQTMTLIASLKAYAVALEDYYNAAYFQSINDDNVAFTLQLRELIISRDLQDAILNRAAEASEELITAKDFEELKISKKEQAEIKWRTAESLQDTDPQKQLKVTEAKNEMMAAIEAVAEAQANRERVENIAKIASDAAKDAGTELAKLRQQIARLQKRVGDAETITVPYRATFRVSAAPGWYAQLNQLDAVAELTFEPYEQQISKHARMNIVGAIPAEGTQTLDEFASTLQQFAIALQAGGSYGPIAAQTTLDSLQASAKRLEGIRSNTTFITEFPGDGNKLQVRFSPAVVPNASRRMLDRNGLNVTALVLVKHPVIKKGSQPVDLHVLRTADIKVKSWFEQGLVLTKKGKYKGPARHTSKILEDFNSSGISNEFNEQHIHAHIPSFATSRSLGTFAFVEEATEVHAWITDKTAASLKGEAVIVTRVTAPWEDADIELSVVPFDGKIKSIYGRDANNKITPGNDIVIHVDLPPGAVQATESDGKKTAKIVPIPLVLRATSDMNGKKTAISKTILLGGSASTSPSGSGSAQAGGQNNSDSNIKKPKLEFKRDGLTLTIPADQLTPELVEVLKASFSQNTQIIIPGVTVKPAISDTPNTNSKK